MSRNYRVIMIPMLFAITMVLLGSVVINMYTRCSDDVKKDVGFHWWIGLLSILGGLFTIVISVLVGIYGDRMNIFKRTVHATSSSDELNLAKESLSKIRESGCNVDELTITNSDVCTGKNFKKTMLKIHPDKNPGCPVWSSDVTKQCNATNDANKNNNI